jgi:hypothetical protein
LRIIKSVFNKYFTKEVKMLELKCCDLGMDCGGVIIRAAPSQKSRRKAWTILIRYMPLN